MQRKGKIARLPLAFRTELNQRLAANEDGAALLDWLNAAPDVQVVLARDFAGEPITKQNLYEWRNGGFVESQTRQELFEQAGELTADAAESDAPACGNLIGHLVALLAVRYAALLARWDHGDNEALRVQLRALHTFTRDLAALHRINQIAERQKIQPASSGRKEKQRADAETTDQERNEKRARSSHDIVAKRQHHPGPVPMPDFAPVAAPREHAIDRHSGSATAQCAADQSVARNPGSPVLDQDLAKSCATEVQPTVPQPGFSCQAGVQLPDRGSVGSNQVKPNTCPPQPSSPNRPVPAPHRAAFGPVTPVTSMPGRGSAKTKNEALTIIADDRPLASASALDTQPRTPFARSSITTDSPLDKVVPVLISPGNAVDQFIAANTRPPETGLLPAALRREIFEAINASK